MTGSSKVGSERTALQLAGLINPSPVALEGMAAVFGSPEFLPAYILLYRKDAKRN